MSHEGLSWGRSHDVGEAIGIDFKCKISSVKYMKT